MISSGNSPILLDRVSAEPLALSDEKFVEGHQLFGGARHATEDFGSYAVSISRRLRQPANRAGDSGNALDHGRSRLGDFALLECNDRQGRKSIEEFARPQQEIRVARPPEAARCRP